jgi:hypothetical protein
MVPWIHNHLVLFSLILFYGGFYAGFYRGRKGGVVYAAHSI